MTGSPGPDTIPWNKDVTRRDNKLRGSLDAQNDYGAAKRLYLTCSLDGSGGVNEASVRQG